MRRQTASQLSRHRSCRCPRCCPPTAPSSHPPAPLPSPPNGFYLCCFADLISFYFLSFFLSLPAHLRTELKARETRNRTKPCNTMHHPLLHPLKHLSLEYRGLMRMRYTVLLCLIRVCRPFLPSTLAMTQLVADPACCLRGREGSKRRNRTGCGHVTKQNNSD